MSEFEGKRYWLVGASEGLGRALAHRLSQEGADLVLSARSAERLRDLVKKLPGSAQAVPVDVADTGSVAKAVREVGEIDGIVWLAGVYWPMSADDWDAEKSEAMADINFTGALRVLSRVVPAMVERGRGHVVITGSLSGFRGLPGAVGYGASKAAVMSLAETLHADLRGSGVRVQLANPGFIKTRLTEKNAFKMPFLLEPEAAAEEMLRLMRSRAFKRNFPRLFGLLFRASQFLPDWAYFRFFARR